MKTTYSIFTVMLLLLMAGCKKSEWFDVKSDIKKTVPVTLQDFEYLLDNFLVMNQSSPALGEVGSDGYYTTEARFQSLPDPMGKNAYTWSYTFPFQDSDYDWNSAYTKIFYCNLVLDGLKKIKPSGTEEQGKWNRVKGNALFHKAKNYFDLAQVYAQPYKASTANTDIGIPLKDGINVTESSVRSSVQAVYEEITKNLSEAADLLPTLPVMLTRGSKAGSYGLLAKTYLIMGEYDKAGSYADLCLKLNGSLIDYNTLSLTATNIGQFNKETIFYSEMTPSTFIYVLSYGFVDQKQFDLYEANDLRKQLFFIVNGDGTINFKGNYTADVILFSGLATDEQYLIRAESFARAGNISAAMKDLNDLLKTRWKNTVTFPLRNAANAEDALRQILVERKKELFKRGIRWSDLKRLNQDDRFKETLTREIGGVTYTLEPNSYKYTLRLADNLMNLSPQLKQTPGW